MKYQFEHKYFQVCTECPCIYYQVDKSDRIINYWCKLEDRIIDCIKPDWCPLVEVQDDK